MSAYTFLGVGTYSATDPGQPIKETGCLLLLATACRSNAETVNVPSGWTTLYAPAGTGVALLGRYATNDASDNIVGFDFWSGSSQNRAVIAAFGGDIYQDLATIVAHFAESDGTNNNLPTAALTVTQPECLIIAFGKKAKSATPDPLTFNDPGALGTRISFQTNAGASSCAFIWARNQQTTPANVSATSWTQNIVESLGYASMVVALKTFTVLALDSAPDPMVVAASAVITGSGFGATQGAGFVKLGGITQAVTAWADGSITITVTRGTLKFGLYDLVVQNNAGVSDTYPTQIQLNPQAGRAFINLGTPYSSPTGRLTSAADLTSGDQISWFNVTGPAMGIANAALATDAAFECDAAVTAFDFEVNDGTGWGLSATQSIQDPPVVPVAVPDIRHVSNITGEGFLAAVGLVPGVVTNINVTDPAVAGTITDQSPLPGVVVNPGSAVNYTFAQKLLVRTVAGQLGQVGSDYLGEFGFPTSSSLVASSTVTAGVIVSQNPRGQDYAVPGSTVQLFISDPTLVTPSIRGRPGPFRR